MDVAMDNGKVTVRRRRQRWISTASAAGRDGGRQRLKATMDDSEAAVVEN
jgi:hypothetical protein